ncbi:MAG TPA: hypothetical protein VHC20_07370 [Candidatus Paceibacterota bacterium]|nr:hypothetical protein [Candidatus Paceibacterota bacterium]
MEQANRKVLITIVVVLGVLILLGAYFLFQGDQVLPGQSTGTTSAPILGQSITDGKGIVVKGTVGGNGEFGAEVNTANAKVGGTLPTIKVNLPKDANGKALMVSLVPAGTKPGVPQEMLFISTITTDGLVYNIQGLRLATLTNVSTGAKTPVAPGTYELEFVLWDHYPFAMDGSFTGLTGGNNATAALSDTFTLAP